MHLQKLNLKRIIATTSRSKANWADYVVNPYVKNQHRALEEYWTVLLLMMKNSL
ncbi:hypothetical protein RND71_035549 [Anisodus tanguticus]|uniref:Uncharacterized protein n=1 Tax=Anisodus tanguticus TaxID=243964 RepID=A0AAE1R5G1_9SOLA|nr:hypothetical protein RND71_035549 [Anisodus tanguticus]